MSYDYSNGFGSSFGGGGGFSLSQYAPVDPLNDIASSTSIPGLDLINRSTSQESSEPSTSKDSSLPSSSGSSSYRESNIKDAVQEKAYAPISKSNKAMLQREMNTNRKVKSSASVDTLEKPQRSQKSHDPREIHRTKSEDKTAKKLAEAAAKERRRLEESKVRKAIREAPAYIPTPINDALEGDDNILLDSVASVRSNSVPAATEKASTSAPASLPASHTDTVKNAEKKSDSDGSENEIIPIRKKKKKNSEKKVPQAVPVIRTVIGQGASDSDLNRFAGVTVKQEAPEEVPEYVVLSSDESDNDKASEAVEQRKQHISPTLVSASSLALVEEEMKKLPLKNNVSTAAPIPVMSGNWVQTIYGPMPLELYKNVLENATIRKNQPKEVDESVCQDFYVDVTLLSPAEIEKHLNDRSGQKENESAPIQKKSSPVKNKRARYIQSSGDEYDDVTWEDPWKRKKEPLEPYSEDDGYVYELDPYEHLKKPAESSASANPKNSKAKNTRKKRETRTQARKRNTNQNKRFATTKGVYTTGRSDSDDDEVVEDQPSKKRVSRSSSELSSVGSDSESNKKKKKQETKKKENRKKKVIESSDDDEPFQVNPAKKRKKSQKSPAPQKVRSRKITKDSRSDSAEQDPDFVLPSPSESTKKRKPEIVVTISSDEDVENEPIHSGSKSKKRGSEKLVAPSSSSEEDNAEILPNRSTGKSRKRGYEKLVAPSSDSEDDIEVLPVRSAGKSRKRGSEKLVAPSSDSEDDDTEIEVLHMKNAEKKKKECATRAKSQKKESREFEFSNPPRRQREESNDSDERPRQVEQPVVRKIPAWLSAEQKKKQLAMERIQRADEKRERERLQKLKLETNAYPEHFQREILRRQELSSLRNPVRTEQQPIEEPHKDERKRKIDTSSTDEPSCSRTQRVQSVDELIDAMEADEDVSTSSAAVPRRIAHTNNAPNRTKLIPPPIPKKRPLTEEQFGKRMKEAEEKAKRVEAENERIKKKKFPTQEELFGEKRSRVGSNEKGTAREARPLFSSASSSVRKPISIKREVMPSMERKPTAPPCLELSSTKIPLSIRRGMLEKMFFDMCDRKVPQAAAEAQKTELEVMRGAKSKDTYRVKMLNTINKMRTQSADVVIPVSSNTVSHTKNLIGPAFNQVSVGINRKNIRTLEQLDSAEVYDLIAGLKANDNDLVENGYPMFTSESPNVAIIQPTKYDKDKNSWIDRKEKRRICCRCRREFHLNLDMSFPMEKAICRYHNRGMTVQGKKQTFAKKHVCCGEEMNQSEGCKLSDVHVTDQLFTSELANFALAPKPSGDHDKRSKAFYALDCEMVYTDSGPALARLTMVDFDGKSVLDVKVKPPTTVLDPNTEFSGLTMFDIEEAVDTLESCRNKLFKLVNSETILIGHSLESDFKAMRLVHYNVVDTSIMFTSGRGTKLSLRSLAADHLKRFIQSDNDDADGHCSFEDAKVCMDLVRFKLKGN